MKPEIEEKTIDYSSGEYQIKMTNGDIHFFDEEGGVIGVRKAYDKLLLLLLK